MKIEYLGKCLVIEEGKEKTLVIGDMHFGYEHELNEAGVLIMRQMYEQLISDLREMFERVGKCRRVIFLGDLKHGFAGINRQEWGDLTRLFDFVSENCDEIVILKGNHDNYLKNVVERWKKESGKGKEIDVYDCYFLGEICFMHGDRDFEEAHEKKIGIWVVWHGHPAIVLKEGVKREKYKCFLAGRYKGKKIIVVPSFAEFVEGSDPREQGFKMAWDFDLGKFDVKIVSDNLEVLDFGLLKDLD